MDDNVSPIIIQGETFDQKLTSISNILVASENIVVLAGAGISVSCGIPDFRSEKGLYNTLNYQELGLTSPEDLFDITTFHTNPRPFFKFAHTLYPGTIEPSPSHAFISHLDAQHKLLRVYTQNIDTLEESAGVRVDKVVYAHGSLRDATCCKCKKRYSAGDIEVDVREGRVPLCTRIRNKRKVSPSTKSGCTTNATKKKTSTTATTTSTTTTTTTIPVERRRSSRQQKSTKTPNYNDDSNAAGDDYEVSLEASMKQRGLCCGVIKPNITFFGEKLGNEVGRRLEQDYAKADMLIVMGTSLSVAPMSKVVEFLPPNIPRILINRTIVKVPKASHQKENGYLFHACLLGNCDDVVKELERKINGRDCLSKSTTIDIDTSYGLVPKHENWTHHQPKETVLLFPGAIISNGAKATSSVANKEHKIVVHCDECNRQIYDEVYCCQTCFDYDLCGACYPKAKLLHADGKHDFLVEKT